jgi:hypothetical protein
MDDGGTTQVGQGVKVVVLRHYGKVVGQGNGGDPQVVDVDTTAGRSNVGTQMNPMMCGLSVDGKLFETQCRLIGVEQAYRGELFVIAQV